MSTTNGTPKIVETTGRERMSTTAETSATVETPRTA
jgi:hypothetical protein